MKTPPLPASLLMLLGLAILCGLGFWQIDRLHWKRDLLLEIEQAWQNEPQAIETSDINRADQQGRKFLRGIVRGTFLNDAAVLIRPRILDGQQGAHLITPLQLGDDSILLVNRGWVPDGKTEEIEMSFGPVAITGTLRYPDQPNSFTPANDPAQGQWYSIDPAMIAKTYDLKGVLPFIMMAERDNNLNKKSYPFAIGGRPDLNNNHLSYAIFWFAMTAALLAVFLFRFVLVKE